MTHWKLSHIHSSIIRYLMRYHFLGKGLPIYVVMLNIFPWYLPDQGGRAVGKNYGHSGCCQRVFLCDISDTLHWVHMSTEITFTGFVNWGLVSKYQY